MPTSATGSPDPAGFTLVELMVVLAIIGLMTAMVAINLPASRDELLHEGDRLAARLAAARDHAIVANRETAAIVDDAGYRFAERSGRDWRPLADAPLVDTRWREGTGVTEPARISFDAVGMSEAGQLVLTSGEYRAIVHIDAAGEVRVDAPR